VTNFLDHCEIVCDSSDRDAWLAARTTGLGASDIPSILGVGFLTPAEVWASKRGLGLPESIDDVERVRWGNVMEPITIQEYAKPYYSGRWAERSGVMYRSKAHPWALATLDATTLHPEHGVIPLEVKGLDAFRAETWQDGPPERVYYQVQTQMLVTGAKCATVACTIGGNRLVWCDVDRDEAAIASIVLRGSRFWDLVQSGEMPPPDTSAEWAQVFAVAHPEDGSVVELGDDVRRMAADFASMKATAKATETRLQMMKNEIIERLGCASEARFSDGTGLTYRTQSRAEHTVKASTFRVLRESAAPKSKRKAA
jgi:putative phage-type endonuclease